MSDEHLTNGWEADLADGDNVVRDTVRNIADRLVFTAHRMGGRIEMWDDLVAIRLPSDNLWANVALVLQPVDTDRPDAIADRLDALYGPGVPAMIFSPVPTPDLSGRGYFAMGHPPLMYRPAGGEAPVIPDGLEIEEVTEDDAVGVWEQALADGFPLDAPGQFERGSVFDGRLLGGDLHFFLGTVDGRPVSTSAVYVSRGLNQVEFVSTLGDARGKGYGEALTWQATIHEPGLPAVLMASDMGRPIYERMGYVTVIRYTGWIRPGPDGAGH